MKWMGTQVSVKFGVILFICLVIVGWILYRDYEPLPKVLQQQAVPVPCLQSDLECWRLSSPSVTETTDLFKYDLGEIFLVKRKILAGNIFNIWPIYRDLYFLKINMKVTKHDSEDMSGFSPAHTILSTRSTWGISTIIPLSFLYPLSKEEINLVKAVSSLPPQESVTGYIVYDVTNVTVGKRDELLLTIVNLPKNVGGVKPLTLKSTWPMFHF